MKGFIGTSRRMIIMLFLIVNLFTCNLFGQISQGGEPYSFSHKLVLPSEVQPNQSELRYISDTTLKDCNSYEFAKFLTLNESLNSSVWQKTTAADGSTIHQLLVHSAGALAIGAYFSNFHIPEGASLFIFSPDHKQVIGAFTAANNTKSGLFATEYLLGDQLIIEYREPYSVKGKGSFVVSDILHAYRAISADNEKGFGGSGDCEVNVNCPEGDQRKSQRDAVLKLLIKVGSSGTLCSGSLINNTSQDRTPYVLTADHCGKASSIADQEQWVFYFHYQSWGCANPTTEPSHKTMVGCQLVAASSEADILGSDFFLVKMMQDVPAEYNPFFVGWNRDGLPSNEGFCIHHPDGDIKKISTYTQPLADANYGGGLSKGFWEVIWSETESGHGVTEGGSSGSPLFDDEGLLIGTLTGGQAYCGGLTLPDYYGKFSKHWDQNGSAANQKLSPWLDPLNSGISKMGGIYLGVDETELTSNQLFEVTPNPAHENITIHFSDPFSQYQILLIDVQGREVYNTVVNNNLLEIIPIQNLRKGIYFLRVQDQKRVQTNKIFKL